MCVWIVIDGGARRWSAAAVDTNAGVRQRSEEEREREREAGREREREREKETSGGGAAGFELRPAVLVNKRGRGREEIWGR